MKYWLCVFVILFSAHAGVVYVDNQHSGTEEGTLVFPFQSMTRALTEVSEGDTVYVRGGTYEEEPLEVRTNGLHIASYPGEWAVFRGPIADSDYGYVMRYAIPITEGTLDRIELEGGYYYCLKFESDWGWDYSKPFEERKGASGIIMTNCRFHGSGRDCIKITPACNDLAFRNCEFYESGARDDSNAEGIDNVNSANMVVENCYFHDIATNGIYAKGGAKGAIIRNNVIENCGVGGIMLGFYTDAEWFNTDENPDYQEAVNPVVYNNYIFNTDAAGIGMYGSLNAKVYNNTLINTAKVHHGSLFMEHGAVWVSDTYTAEPINIGAWVVNNIVYNDVEVAYDLRIRAASSDTTCLIDYNLFYNSYAEVQLQLDDFQKWPAYSFDEYQTQTPYGLHALMANPGFDNNWHLTAGSPAIDMGFTDSLFFDDYDGHVRNGWDIGADEFSLEVAKKVPPQWSDNPVALEQSHKGLFPTKRLAWSDAVSLAQVGELKLSCFSLNGKRIEIGGFSSESVQQLSKGIYLMQCSYEGRNYTFRIVR